MNRRPHVALIIESSRGYGRGLLEGIAEYIRTHDPWAIYHEERGIGDPSPVWLKDWRGDGIIARIETRSMLADVMQKGLPVVDLRGKFDLPFPLIETNEEEVARLAAEHLIEHGFRQFAYVGFAGANYSERRLRFFPALIAKAGFPCHVYPPRTKSGRAPRRQAETHGILYEDEIAEWIALLPKPVGIMACNDIRGQQVLNACRAIGVAVPEDVAVIGVDNDTLLCELSDPPLSSVAPDTHRIGYEAASILAAMMAGEAVPLRNQFIEPAGVVTRLSTDVLAIEDRAVARAVRFIREHAHEGIQVSDVVADANMSRTSLSLRFASVMKRTLKAEILRVQLNRARQLLVETDFTLAQIADLSGFKHAEYFSVAFKQKFNMPPGEYRRQKQIAPGTSQDV